MWKRNRLLKWLLAAAIPFYAGEEDGGGNVNTNENGEVVGTGNDARIALLNSIGDSADRQRAEDFQDVNDDGTTSTFEAPPAEDGTGAADDQAAATEQQSATEAAAAAAAQTGAEPQPKLYKIKVNGRDLELTEEQILERASKVEAADAYLAEAARLKRAMESQPSGKPDADTGAQVNQDEEDLALVRAIQLGTEEEALQAIRKLKATGPSSDDLSTKIDERLAFNTAISKFNSEFTDIVSDPYLRKMAQDMDVSLVQQGDTRSYEERFTAIGNEIRGWLNKKAPAPSQNNDQAAAPAKTAEGKDARKAAAAPAPKAASAKTGSTVQEEKEESASDVIAAMAQRRGGPQWMQPRS